MTLGTNSKGELVMTRKMIAQGWLNKMLVEAGVIKEGEVARKERCFADFQAQLLYIEGMKAVLGWGGIRPTSCGTCLRKRWQV